MSRFGVKSVCFLLVSFTTLLFVVSGCNSSNNVETIETTVIALETEFESAQETIGELANTVESLSNEVAASATEVANANLQAAEASVRAGAAQETAESSAILVEEAAEAIATISSVTPEIPLTPTPTTSTTPIAQVPLDEGLIRFSYTTDNGTHETWFNFDEIQFYNQVSSDFNGEWDPNTKTAHIMLAWSGDDNISLDAEEEPTGQLFYNTEITTTAVNESNWEIYAFMAQLHSSNAEMADPSVSQTTIMAPLGELPQITRTVPITTANSWLKELNTIIETLNINKEDVEEVRPLFLLLRENDTRYVFVTITETISGPADSTDSYNAITCARIEGFWEDFRCWLNGY